MRIVIHVSGYYDWEPVPAGTTVTAADIRARRVKPSMQTGKYLMRVPKKCDPGSLTHTTITLPEHQIIALVIQEMIKDKVILTRAQAVGHYLARHVMPHHAHRSWMRKIEPEDDGPDEALFRAKVQEQVDAGNIEALDVNEMVAAYLAHADHVEHLHAHFGVNKVVPEKVAQ